MSLAELARRVWFFVRRDRLSAELAEEMRLHVELRARREREAGLDPAAAERRARRQFGNAPHLVEESRDQWGMRWADELATDLKYGVRALRRAPLPSAIVILTLAVGIGATLAMFTVMDAALFRPLPVRAPEQLVVLRGLDVPLQGARMRPSPSRITELRENRRIFESVGAYAAGGLNLTGGVQPMRVQVGLVTPSALSMLGVPPLLGRLFTEDEERPDGPDVVVLSHALWRSQFGGDRDVLGRRLALNDRSYEIVGVMPPRFAFPEGSELWIPMTVPLTMARTEIFGFLLQTDGIARLAPGVTPEIANADFLATLREGGWTPRDGQPLPELTISMRGYFTGDSATRLWMVMGLAALLLLAACANICGLLLARWSGRRREIAVKTAIGAGRPRLLRQLATESAVLGALGAAAGLVVAVLGIRTFNALIPPELAALTPPHIDGRALVALLVLAILTAVAIGTLPALAASRGDLSQVIKSGGDRGGSRRGAGRLAGALVVLEVGLAVILLVGSGLLVKSLARLHDVETGIRAEGVVTARVALSRAKYSDFAARRHFHARLEHELRQIPGGVTAAITSTLPLRGEWHPPVAFGLLDRPQGERDPFAEFVYVTPDYFDAMGIRLLAGRTFVPADTVPQGGGAIISDSLARAWWPGRSPLGTRIRGGNAEHVIVGVVSDVRGTSLDGRQHAQIYFPGRGSAQSTIVVRSALPASDALAHVRAAVARVDPSQVVYDMKTMEQVAADAVAEQRTTSVLATIFGVITLLLSALGLYGLLAFGVVQRTRELGIRFALGARRAQVVRGVVGEGVVLTGLGVALGLLAAYGATRWLEALLFGVTPTDGAIFSAAPAVLLATAVVAAAIPAVRAARVDPLTALRNE